MKIVGIIGPFRAATGWAIELNCRRAEEMALEVWRLGAVAICPHKNTRGWHGVLPDHVWLDGYLEVLKRCDAALLVGEWEKSKGSLAEAAHAHRLGLPVFDGLESLQKWLATQE